MFCDAVCSRGRWPRLGLAAGGVAACRPRSSIPQPARLPLQCAAASSKSIVANGRDDSLHIGQRGVFVDRVVADHDVAFADENRRADHAVPKIGLRRQMRDDHLADAAILRVFLHDDDPSGFSHRFFNRLAVPRRNRAQINQLDARFVFDLFESLRAISPSCCPRRPASRPSQPGVCALCPTAPRESAPRFRVPPRACVSESEQRTGSSQCIAVQSSPAASSGVAGNDDVKSRDNARGLLRSPGCATNFRPADRRRRAHKSPSDISSGRTNASADSRCWSPADSKPGPMKSMNCNSKTGRLP